MNAVLFGKLIGGNNTICVERKSGDTVKKSYVNLRAKGKKAEFLAQLVAKKVMVRVTGVLDVEKVDGADAPFLEVKSIAEMPSGTPHFSLVYGNGNVTRDSEIKVLSGDWQVLGYGIASNRKVNSVQKTSFFTVSMFAKNYEDGANRLSKIAPHVLKGKGLSVSGQLDIQEWNGEDQKLYRAVNIILDDFEFLPGGKRSEVDDQLPNYAKQPADAALPSYIGKESDSAGEGLPEIEINEEEIPF